MHPSWLVSLQWSEHQRESSVPSSPAFSLKNRSGDSLHHRWSSLDRSRIWSDGVVYLQPHLWFCVFLRSSTCCSHPENYNRGQHRLDANRNYDWIRRNCLLSCLLRNIIFKKVLRDGNTLKSLHNRLSTVISEWIPFLISTLYSGDRSILFSPWSNEFFCVEWRMSRWVLICFSFIFSHWITVE